MSGLKTQTRLISPKFHPYEAVFSKLANNNPLDKEFLIMRSWERVGMTSSKRSKSFKSGLYPADLIITINYKRLGRKMKWLCSKRFCRGTITRMLFQIWMQTKGMLKLGFTLRNLANICPHQSTIYENCSFCESDKGLKEKKEKKWLVDFRLCSPQKAVDDETFIRKLSNYCKSIVGLDANQLYSIWRCQDMPTGLHMRW